MAQLVAITYPDEFRAAEVLAALKRLQGEYSPDLDDACVVTRSTNGKIKLHQAVNLTGNGATTGVLWGTVIKLIFLNPPIGPAGAQ